MNAMNTARGDAAWYFEPLADHHFVPTVHVGGGWNPAAQHIAPAFGLLTHLIEQHRDKRRGKDLAIGRLSFDIHGVLPMEPFAVELEVVRPGRTIELVEARIVHGMRTAVVLRAWLLAERDCSGIAGSPCPAIPGPDDLPAWEFASVWPGGFVRSVQARRREQAPGKCIFWVNTDTALLKGSTVSPIARLMGLVDVANGATPRVAPSQAAFPNLDLTAHLLRAPVGSWIGFDTAVSFGPTGVGLTHSVIHDIQGPLGVVSQCLTVRPADGAKATAA
ncbi:thioesterase family protein, partial [Rudaea sp.]|uniref:thioesterase family protein n=1 Tax=Rudaea sp. TaxID=2136325 RepID=UPI0032200544